MKTVRRARIKLAVRGALLFSVVLLAVFKLADRLTEFDPQSLNRKEVNLYALQAEADQYIEELAEANLAQTDQFLDVYSQIEKRSKLKPHEIWELARAVIDESAIYEKDPMFTLSIIKIESNYDRYAVSPVNALGLMQLLPSTARAIAEDIGLPYSGPQTLFDIRSNVKLGLYYFTRLENRFGSAAIALAAYNFGPTYIGRVIKEGGRIPRDYASKVLQVYKSNSGEDS